MKILFGVSFVKFDLMLIKFVYNNYTMCFELESVSVHYDLQINLFRISYDSHLYSSSMKL